MQPHQPQIGSYRLKPNRKALHIRLYTTEALKAGNHISLGEEQVHYLAQVMRQKTGDQFALFNGQDGEWIAELISIQKKYAEVRLIEQTRPQRTEPDIWFLFAPLKHQKNERLIAQATELGVSKIIPVLMKHGIVDKIHRDRWQACAIEAAEQSERLNAPIVEELTPLTSLLSSWGDTRTLIVADESGGGKTTAEILNQLKATIAMLIGPEGGFAQQELALLRTCSFVQGVGLGPRILKADTAAITLLSLLANQCGDWNLQPEFRSA